MEKEKVVKIFAENIRVERARKQYTQEWLAEQVGITPEYLAKLEKGRNNPTIHVVVNLAIALGVGIEKLITPDMLKEEK